MSDRTDVFSDDDVSNQNIAGFINKNDLNDLTHQLEYSDIKIRLNKLIEAEHAKYKEILHNGNQNYTMKEQDGVLIIEINDLITNKSDLVEKIKQSGKNKAVISFNSKAFLSSSMLGELTYFYKEFKKIRGEIVFWNSSKSELIERTIKECRLDRIIKLVDYLDDAIKYLSQI
jgi:anti-anti-sigma regulatory factor